MIRKGLAALIVAAGLYFLLFGGEYTFLDLWRLDRQHERAVAELQATRLEVAELEAKADSLATDSAALERLARERYGLIKDGERLYRFATPDSAAEPR